MPGDGDCQYHALVKSASLQGLEIGAVTDVRVWAYQQLTSDPERYAPFMMEDFWAYAAKVLVKGTWGDDVTLQAFCDASGFSVEVYDVGLDATVKDYVLR